MYQRKCVTCGNEVLVESKYATIVRCNDCKSKLGKEKRDYDTDEFVYCRICHDVKRRLDSHIKSQHGMTVEEYLRQFSDASIYSKNLIESRKRDDESKAKTSKALKASWANEEIKTRRIELMIQNPSMKGRILSKEHRQKIADSVHETKSKDRHKTLERRAAKKRLQCEQLESFIVCPLCLRETNDEVMSRIRLITLSHLKRHKYTYDMFIEEFPDQKLSIDEIGRQHAESMSGKKHFNYGKQLDEQVRQNIARGINTYWQSKDKRYCIECFDKLPYDYNDSTCHKCNKKEYGTVDTYNKIHCHICNLMKSDLSSHIKVDHNMAIQEYKDQYCVNVVCSQSITDAMSSGRIGLKLSDEHKQNIGTTLKTRNKLRLQWERDFDINQHKHVQDRQLDCQLSDTEDQIYCRYCFAIVQRLPQHIETHNLTTHMYQQLFPDAPLVASNLAKRIMKATLGTIHAKGADNVGMNWGYGGYRKDVGHYVRSMIEANFCRMLKLNNVKYKYEPEIFELDHERFTVYIPDILLLDQFHIWPSNVYIELKKKVHDEDIEKVKVFLEQCGDHEIYFLAKYSHEWDVLRRMYKSSIPLWEDSIQNIKTQPDRYL